MGCSQLPKLSLCWTGEKQDRRVPADLPKLSLKAVTLIALWFAVGMMGSTAMDRSSTFLEQSGS